MNNLLGFLRWLTTSNDPLAMYDMTMFVIFSTICLCMAVAGFGPRLEQRARGRQS